MRLDVSILLNETEKLLTHAFFSNGTLLDSWINIGIDELKVGKVVGEEMEQPESPHDWVAHEVLNIPELECLHLSLLHVS